MDAMTASQWNRWLELGKTVLVALTDPVDEGAAPREESRSYAHEDREPPSTEFEIACEFLDLSAEDPFTRADFERKVREFRVLFHRIRSLRGRGHALPGFRSGLRGLNR